MKGFTYLRAESEGAARAAAASAGTMLLAGGTNLLDLAKCGVAAPDRLVDISHLAGLDTLRVDDAGATIGALARMSQVAGDAAIRDAFPAIAQSLAQAASAQIRNMATIGGNLAQRTRCAYFRDPATFAACNKRAPGSGCAAIGGATRTHALLGASDACIATYPGDLAIALVAFDALVHLGAHPGARVMRVEDFFLPPGDTPHIEHTLAPGEMITAITIPASPAARRATYLKIRDRQSYEFAAASAAVGLELEADGKTIRDIRVALGGVATRPWRARAVEAALLGQVLEPGIVARAANLAMAGAISQGANQHKIALVPRVVARAILSIGDMA